jgi:hypothetical protein
MLLMSNGSPRALGKLSDNGRRTPTTKMYADCESWRGLFRARVRNRLPAWHGSHTVDRPSRRHEHGRTDGNTHHARSHHCDGAMDGSATLAVPFVPFARLGMGGIALVLVLVAEFGLVLWLRGMSIRGILAAETPWQERSIM